ncbi:MAG: DUF488 domain-containing protein [bacterium]
MTETLLFSIGHSNHSWPDFMNLLEENRVNLLCDVRSRPRSRFPWFNRKRLEPALSAGGIEYRWMGDVLGGKPAKGSLYLPGGKPDYVAMAAEAGFLTGIAELVRYAQGEQRVAVMCAEGDPVRCHRERLIGPAVRAAGIQLIHLLPDGNRLLL